MDETGKETKVRYGTVQDRTEREGSKIMDETWKGGDRRAVAGRTSRTQSRRQREKRDPGLMQAGQGRPGEKWVEVDLLRTGWLG